MSGLNILLVGIACYPNGTVLTTPVRVRDQSRVLELRKHYNTVFTLAPEKPGADAVHHCEGKFGPRGALNFVKLLNTVEHVGKKIDYICVECIRMYGDYYRQIVMNR